MEWKLIYADSLVLCMIATAVLFFCHMKTWRPNRTHLLAVAYMSNILSLGADIVWAMLDGVPRYSGWNYLINVVEFSSFGICAYAWLLYCCDAFPFPVWHRRRTKLLAGLPMALVIGLIAVSPITHWLFYVDEWGFYRRGPYFFFQQVGFLYLILVSVLAIVSRRRSELSSERDQFSVMAYFSLPPMTLGLLQLLLPEGALPTLQFSVFLSLLLVYANEQNRRITRDSLTKLVNRYVFEDILTEEMLRQKREPRQELLLLMGDLDGFKSINDTYGHLEGDRALQDAAYVLELVGTKFGATVARMGGDEFLILMRGPREETAAEYGRQVEQGLLRASVNRPYRLSISLGAARYDGFKTMSQFIQEADEKMYVSKNRRLQAE